MWRVTSSLVLVFALCLSGVPDLKAQDSCPTTVGGGGVWPSSRKMNQLGEACCMFEWVSPTKFGTEEELTAAGAPTSGQYCVDAVTLEEFVAHTTQPSPCSQCGPYITEEKCAVVSNVCAEWGPEAGSICCKAYDDNRARYGEDVTEFHSFPWLPIETCPSGGNKLVGMDLTSAGSSQGDALTCPGRPESSNVQTIELPGILSPHIKDTNSPHVLVFHRKKQLDTVKLKIKIVDANGEEVIPLSEFDLASPVAGRKRRQLMRAAGGGSSGKGTSTSSSNKDNDATDDNNVPFDSTAGVIWTKEDLDLVSNAGQQYEYIEGKGIRYVNGEGYIIPFDSDLSTLEVSGQYAAIGGGGTSFWGTFQKEDSSHYYGLPTQYSSAWFTDSESIVETDETLSGDAIWVQGAQIVTWGQPISCPPEGCVLRSTQHHYDDYPDKEFRSSHTECSMYMDINMNTVFFPDDYAMPFTVTIEDVEADLDLGQGDCTNGQQDIGSIASPGDAGLYVSLLRLAEIEVRPSPDYGTQDGGFDGYFSGGLGLWQSTRFLFAALVAVASVFLCF